MVGDEGGVATMTDSVYLPDAPAIAGLSFRSIRWKIQKYGLRGYSDSKEE